MLPKGIRIKHGRTIHVSDVVIKIFVTFDHISSGSNNRTYNKGVAESNECNEYVGNHSFIVATYGLRLNQPRPKF